MYSSEVQQPPRPRPTTTNPRRPAEVPGRPQTAFEISVDRARASVLPSAGGREFSCGRELQRAWTRLVRRAVLQAAVRDQAPAHAGELVEYLRNGTVLVSATTFVHDVLSPTNAVIGGWQLLTDGRWHWHSDLAYYVERYHVALDPRFLAHAQGNDWTVPQLTEAEMLALEAVLLGDVTD